MVAHRVHSNNKYTTVYFTHLYKQNAILGQLYTCRADSPSFTKTNSQSFFLVTVLQISLSTFSYSIGSCRFI